MGPSSRRLGKWGAESQPTAASDQTQPPMQPPAAPTTIGRPASASADPDWARAEQRRGRGPAMAHEPPGSYVPATQRLQRLQWQPYPHGDCAGDQGSCLAVPLPENKTPAATIGIVAQLGR